MFQYFAYHVLCPLLQSVVSFKSQLLNNRILRLLNLNIHLIKLLQYVTNPVLSLSQQFIWFSLFCNFCYSWLLLLNFFVLRYQMLQFLLLHWLLKLLKLSQLFTVLRFHCFLHSLQYSLTKTSISLALQLLVPLDYLLALL